ncbi:MAG: MoaD/ThiS family protein [Synergistaceae bacterium]|jgi:molybdopterin converting factor small subunit|nr:MoaD/ThiS family protein [Synergistaceae bacterium]
MPVTIQIPAALRAFANGQTEVSAEGATAGEVIAAFAEAYPDIGTHLYDETGALRSFINVYVGDANIKNLDGLDTPVKDGDSVMLVPAIAGGAPGSAWA